jgi:hypothetical protein
MLFALFIPFLKSVNTAILLTCEEEVPYGVIQAVLSVSIWVPRDSDIITFSGVSVSVSTSNKIVQWYKLRFQE